MSTRWYPIYHRGNPQLRVFLPNFWMKLIRPPHNTPDNTVHFAVSMEMSKIDVKNYLAKIYNVPVIEVQTHIKSGRTFKDHYFSYVKKNDDVKIACVTLASDQKFEFPDIFNEEERDKKMKKEKRTIDEIKKGFKEYVDKAKDRPNLPPWFSF